MAAARRLGDQSERARKTVSARVRDALAKIDQVHPALAEHLRRALRMGTVCSYVTEPTDDLETSMTRVRDVLVRPGSHVRRTRAFIVFGGLQNDDAGGCGAGRQRRRRTGQLGDIAAVDGEAADHQAAAAGDEQELAVR